MVGEINPEEDKRLDEEINQMLKKEDFKGIKGIQRKAKRK